jgi:isopenicillin N synthase-like dioxygenase
MADVPVVSMGGSPEAVARQLADAYQSVGFCVLVDHGVPAEVTAAAFEASRRFHDLPREDKLALAIDEHHRGFIAMNTSTIVTSSVAEVTRPNQSESLMVLHDSHPDDAGLLLAGSNQWPPNRPDIREPLERYNAVMTALGQSIVPLVAVALGESPDVFGEAFDRPTTWLRMLRYPPRPADAPPDLFGSAPHTDYGFITLVASPAIGGLEVRHPDGEWVRPPAVEGGLVMNAGDMLHRWSNGRFLSTPHRVINDQPGERWSIPFFFDPHVATVVEPLPSGGVARFEPVRFEDYLAERLRKNYRQHTDPATAG